MSFRGTDHGATPLPSGTVTFLFSDIESSTQLLRGLGRERYAALLADHNALLRRVFAEEGGVEIDHQGDAFFAAFPSAEAAARSAVAIQRAVAAHAWPDGRRVGVRLGLHTGEAAVSDEGYVGIAVHQAARIGDLGHGGQVLLSRTTAALVESELPPEVSLRELGSVSLDGIDRTEQVFQLVIAGLPGEFPRLRRRPAASSVRPERAGPMLLEREAELSVLEHCLAGAAAGAGRLVVIEGRAGIGKTRLLAALRAHAESAGLAILSARGGELERDFAFGIVRQLFEPVLADSASHERRELLDGAALAATPVFEAVAAAADEEDATAVSFATLHALYWVAANFALRKPALLVVDDLHLADAPSLRWLAYIQRRLDGLPLLLAVATRPPRQSRETLLLTEILSESSARVVRPAELTAAAVARLAHETFGVEAADSFVAACVEATSGNPLFVQALLDTLHRQGVHPSAAEASRVHEIGPEPVSRAVTLRLARLPSEATALARAVAVLGNRVALQDAAALAGLEPNEASELASLLAQVDVLRPELPLEFTHPVMRAAVYEALRPSDRNAAHRRAADLLAATQAEPELVAAHLEHVPPAGDAFVVETLRRAAERALARGASDVAISLLRRALEEPPEPGERGQVLQALGLAERLVDTESAIAHLREAIAVTDVPARAGRLALELGRALQRGNRHPEAIEVLDHVRSLIGDDADMAQSLTAELISASWWEPDHLPIVEAELANVREDALVDGNGGDLLKAVLAYAEARQGGDRERAIGLSEASSASGRIPVTGSRALYLAGYALIVAGRTETAIAGFHEGFLEGLRRGDGVLAAGCLLFRSLAHLHEGDLAAADEALAQISEHADFQMMRPYRAAFEAWVALERGSIGRAEQILAAAGLPDRLPANGHLMFFHLVRARTRFRLDPRAGLEDLLALGEISDALGQRNPAFLPWRPYAALALHAADRRGEALALARESVELARTWGAGRMVGVTLRTLGLIEGGAAGLRSLEEAVDVLASSTARLEHAKALVELGAALRRANRRADSRPYLLEALDEAHRLGAIAVGEQAKVELAAAGARPRRLTLRGLDSLTPSERRVVDLAAQEMTNKDIAQALFVTPKTVEVHLSSAYRKLDISSRTQLAGAIAAQPVV